MSDKYYNVAFNYCCNNYARLTDWTDVNVMSLTPYICFNYKFLFELIFYLTLLVSSSSVILHAVKLSSFSVLHDDYYIFCIYLLLVIISKTLTTLRDNPFKMIKLRCRPASCVPWAKSFNVFAVILILCNQAAYLSITFLLSSITIFSCS